MSGFASILSSPAVQDIAMTLIKDLINSIASKKSKNDDEHVKEIEELKKRIQELVKEKESDSATILEMKRNELRMTSQRNEALANEVTQLRNKLVEQEKAGSLSFDLLREREEMLEKINNLEGELKNSQVEKDLKETEAQEFKKECEEQKQSCKELNDLVRVLTNIGKESSINSPSTSNSNNALDKEADCLSKLAKLIENTNLNPEKSKKTRKKKNKNTENKDSSSQNNNTQSTAPYQNMACPSNISHMSSMSGPFNMPGMPNMPVMSHMPGMSNMPGPANMSDPSNMPGMPGYTGQQYYPYTPGPSSVDNYSNMHGMNTGMYHNMPGPHQPNMPGPHQPNNYYQPKVGPPLQMGMPHQAQHQNMPPPLFSPSAPPGVSSHNWNQQGNPHQPNIVNKPNNFGSRQNKKNNNVQKENNTKGKQVEGETKETDSNKAKNVKSGSSFDLWGQLDKLKDTIKDKKSSKSELLSQVPALMTEVSKSTIPSKDKFMVELSECVEIISKIPESSNYNDSTSSNPPRRNYRTDFKKSFNKEYNKGEGYSNTGRGGFQRRGDGGRRFSQGVGRSGNDSNKSTNQKSDDNNCSDDDVSSLCSEPAMNQGRAGFQHGGNSFKEGQQRYDNRKENYRCRGGFQRRGDGGRRFPQGVGQSGNDSNKSTNQKSDDNNCSDDDVSSLCSEPAMNQGRAGFQHGGNRFKEGQRGYDNKKENYRDYRGRGRGGGRGQWRGGRGKYRPKQQQQESRPASSSAENTQPCPAPLFPRANQLSSYPASDISSYATCDADEAFSNIPVEMAQESTTVNFNAKKGTRAKVAENDLINFDIPDETRPQEGAAYASNEIMESFIGHEIPTLMEAILKKIDVTLKVKNCLLVATNKGNVVNEKPRSLLDIIQFKETYPDAVCVYQ